MAAVGTCDAALWEPAVQSWIAAAAALPERTAQVVRAARAAASAPPPEVPAQSLPEVPPQSPALPSAIPSATPPAAPRKAPPAGSRKPGRLIPARASDDDLAALLVPRLAAGEEVSTTRVVKLVREAADGRASIGHERAGKVLALARQKALPAVAPARRKRV
jgi:hypothetical protein